MCVQLFIAKIILILIRDDDHGVTGDKSSGASTPGLWCVTTIVSSLGGGNEVSSGGKWSRT